MDPQLKAKVEEYLKWDKNESTRSQIAAMAASSHDLDKLRKLLMVRMEFGTAGLRSRMGPGYSQMNDLTIVQTAQGLLKYLTDNHSYLKPKGIIVGFDGRHNSKKWASITANIFTRAGWKVYLFRDFNSTPFLAYGVRHFKTACGVMVTASHNPKDDNGYKVYWENGAQILSPHDKGIASAILQSLEPQETSWQYEDVTKNPLCLDPMPELEDTYMKVQKETICFTEEENGKSDVKFVYTAMHGVGAPAAQRIFHHFGFKHLVLVEEQIKPDPEFPTVKFPNPEEGKSALELAIATANRAGVTVICANDPDADRMAVAEKLPSGNWKILSGNELATLLGWWMWTNWRKRNPHADLSKVYMIASTVSSKILRAIAQKEGFNFEETLTGFKWIANKAYEIMQKGGEVIFAFEEAIGFMCGTTVLDKDGIGAFSAVCEMTSHLYNQNLSLVKQLDHIFDIYGKHVSNNSYYFCYEPPKIVKMFERLRRMPGGGHYPFACGRFKVTGVRDLTVDYDSSYPDKKARLPVSASSQMITFTFDNGAIVTLRTSGTEPKIKYYSELCGKPGDKRSMAELEAELAELIGLMVEEFYQPKLNGFTARSY
uniref:Phosphoglucomutase (alpha-D-glucose-1,6-bisphosphate-dependent) n=1 Tax=Echinococcus granulosus TaxID=6210 RepID=A0A068WZL7_ECHGR|nr:phosphoglucomutase 2 [Echinococcus granulosus]